MSLRSLFLKNQLEKKAVVIFSKGALRADVSLNLVLNFALLASLR